MFQNEDAKTPTDQPTVVQSLAQPNGQVNGGQPQPISNGQPNSPEEVIAVDEYVLKSTRK